MVKRTPKTAAICKARIYQKKVSDSSDIQTDGIYFRQFENIYDAPEHSATGARTE
jgi:hypothetical protein